MIDQKQIAEKARKHINEIRSQYDLTPVEQEFGQSSYQTGYEDCQKDMAVKFDRSFESLYKTAISMADNCIVNKTPEQRIEKLKEEHGELIEAFEHMISQPHIYREHVQPFEDELSDVLFVLLHVAHKVSALTPFNMLHKAMTKMLARMNDAEYSAKN